MILHEEAEDGNAMPDLARPVQAVKLAVDNLIKVILDTIVEPALQNHCIGSHIFTTRKQSLGQGNVFTHVYHSVHKEGGLYDVTSYLAARSHVPFGGGGLWSHFPSRRAGGSLSRGVSLTETPWTENPPPKYSKEQAVRILLECILVHLCIPTHIFVN